MYRTAAAFGALALLLTSVDISAQTRPDLSGTWTVVAQAAPPAGAPPAGAPPAGAPGGGAARGGGGRGGGRGGMMGLGQSATIAQTATQLTITRTVAEQQVRSVYNLDGSPSSNTMSFGGQDIVQVSTAAWDANNKLVIRTPAAGGAGGETVMALSLNAQGQLVLETTAPGRGGGAPTTTTQTYTK